MVKIIKIKSMIFSSIIILSIMVVTPTNSEDFQKCPNEYTCLNLFREFDISPKIKSTKGWMRVKYKNSIEQYISVNNHRLTITKKEALNECLIKYSDNLNDISHTIGGK